MPRPPELGLPEDRKKDSDKSSEKADKVSNLKKWEPKRPTVPRKEGI